MYYASLSYCFIIEQIKIDIENHVSYVAHCNKDRQPVIRKCPDDRLMSFMVNVTFKTCVQTGHVCGKFRYSLQFSRRVVSCDIAFIGEILF